MFIFLYPFTAFICGQLSYNPQPHIADRHLVICNQLVLMQISCRLSYIDHSLLPQVQIGLAGNRVFCCIFPRVSCLDVDDTT